jgi:hypothetical protein
LLIAGGARACDNKVASNAIVTTAAKDLDLEGNALSPLAWRKGLQT